MEEAGQADPELVADLEELQNLLQEVMGEEELQERMAELAEALQAESQAQANQSLGDLAEQQREFQEQLGDALDAFRRAAVEQDFRATTAEMEELARLEQAVSDALREADDPELRADQQAQLAQRAEAVEERMEDLQERLTQLNEQTAASQVSEARQAAADAQQQMQAAEQQARQGDSQAASDQAQQAADQLGQAASQLQQAQTGMAQQTQLAAQEALTQAAEDALSLARRQNELLRGMEGANQQGARRHAERHGLAPTRPTERDREPPGWHGRPRVGHLSFRRNSGSRSSRWRPPSRPWRTPALPPRPEPPGPSKPSGASIRSR